MIKEMEKLDKYLEKVQERNDKLRQDVEALITVIQKLKDQRDYWARKEIFNQMILDGDDLELNTLLDGQND